MHPVERVSEGSGLEGAERSCGSSSGRPRGVGCQSCRDYGGAGWRSEREGTSQHHTAQPLWP